VHIEEWLSHDSISQIEEIQLTKRPSDFLVKGVHRRPFNTRFLNSITCSRFNGYNLSLM